MRLLAELRRRNVIRMAGLYLVGAWLITQVSSTVLPMFGAPDWLPRSVVILLALGFLPALIFAWVFELTPEGIKRDAEVKPEDSIAPQTARRMDRVIIAVLICALVYFAADKFVLAPRRSAGQGVQLAAASDKSIAVLPFENLSDDKANAYFADGMQDEILTKLSKIGTLRVISRTSTLQFASHPGNLTEIAQKLAVATILEGSVQKSGNKVRINVQLIRALGDEHLWAETYDRTLDDVFGVQGEVAGTIADKLGAALTGDARRQVNDISTHSAVASDAYLRGLSLLRQGYSLSQENAAIHAFEEAVAADPQFAAAWARLARGYSHLIFMGTDSSPERAAAAKHALQTAEQLQPETLESLAARAYYIFRVQGDYEEARKRFEALHVRWPNDVDVMLTLSYVLTRQGNQSEADALITQALTLDPLNVQVHKLHAFNASYERRWDEVIAETHAVLALAPADAEARSIEAVAWLARGDLARAAQLIGPAPKLLYEEGERPHYNELERLQRSYATSIARLEQMLETPDPHAGPLDALAVRAELADMQQLAGDHAAQDNYTKARDALQEMLRQKPNDPFLLSGLVQVEAGMGNEKAAFAALDALQNKNAERKDMLIDRVTLEARARLLARFGHKDEAIAGLRYLLGVPYGAPFNPVTPATLRLDPDFDALRNDPEFQKLLQDAPAAKAAP